jgi:hypothetical protein
MRRLKTYEVCIVGPDVDLSVLTTAKGSHDAVVKVALAHGLQAIWSTYITELQGGTIRYAFGCDDGSEYRVYVKEQE